MTECGTDLKIPDLFFGGFFSSSSLMLTFKSKNAHACVAMRTHPPDMEEDV